MPGVNLAWYPFSQWLLSLIVSTPVYILGYIGIIRSLRQDFKRHIWVLGLVLSLLAFSTAFYVQNRFRTITLEPSYLMYAAATTSYLLHKFSGRYKSFAESIEPETD